MVAATLVLTIVAVTGLVDVRTGAPRLRVDSSVDRLLPDDDESREYAALAHKRFGIDEALLVALVVDDVFTERGLALVVRVTEALRSLPHVEQVVSLATVSNVRSSGDEVEIGPFLDPMPRADAEIEQVRRDVRTNPLYSDVLVSEDARTTALLVYLDASLSDQEIVDGDLDLAVKRAAEAAVGPDAQVMLTGPQHVKATTTRLILSGLAVVLPVAFGVMALVGFFAYRSPASVLIALSTVTLAIVWTLGWVGYTGVALNLVTTIVPPVLLVIGFAYSIHVVSAYHRAFEHDPDEVARVGGAAAWSQRHVAFPVVLTGLTTMAGFLALTISPFPAVREFGWISMLGVAQVVVLSLTFAPALLQLRRGLPARTPIDGAGRSVDATLRRLGEFDVRHRRAMLAAGAVVVLVSVAGMARVEVNSDLISNFEPDHPARVEFESIDRSLGGAMPFVIVLESTERDAFIEPRNLRLLEELQIWLEAQPEIGKTTSIADYVKVLHRSIRAGAAEAMGVPDRAAMVDQLLFFFSAPIVEDLVDGPRRSAVIQVRAHTMDTASTGNLVARIEERLRALPPPLRANVLGEPVLLSRAMDGIARGQIETLSVALLFILMILSLLFTSFRVGAVALLPNVIPVLFYFGTLGFTGIGLNTTTGLFACMILGIAVDDTIHLLTHFNAEARGRADEREGAVRALLAVGRPVTITTIALCIGFLSLSTSELRNQIEFGLLGSFVLAFAWLVDVTFTPALASGMRIVTLWDALTFDLGSRPQDSIPMLSGLSNAQARIAALMMGVVRFEAGQRVMQMGDPESEVYVVIDGELRVSTPSRDGAIELTRASRGDVLGEVALHQGQRTANVDALIPTRCLYVTKEKLEYLGKRYPRIAARVFWNLSEIMAQRMDRLTKMVSAASRSPDPI